MFFGKKVDEEEYNKIKKAYISLKKKKQLIEEDLETSKNKIVTIENELKEKENLFLTLTKKVEDLKKENNWKVEEVRRINKNFEDYKEKENAERKTLEEKFNDITNNFEELKKKENEELENNQNNDFLSKEESLNIFDEIEELEELNNKENILDDLYGEISLGTDVSSEIDKLSKDQLKEFYNISDFEFLLKMGEEGNDEDLDDIVINGNRYEFGYDIMLDEEDLEADDMPSVDNNGFEFSLENNEVDEDLEEIAGTNMSNNRYEFGFEILETDNEEMNSDNYQMDKKRFEFMMPSGLDLHQHYDEDIVISDNGYEFGKELD